MGGRRKCACACTYKYEWQFDAAGSAATGSAATGSAPAGSAATGSAATGSAATRWEKSTATRAPCAAGTRCEKTMDSSAAEGIERRWWQGRAARSDQR